MNTAPPRSLASDVAPGFACGLLALAGAACVAHVSHRHESPPVYAEIEPNDSAFSAPFYGGLRAGDAFGIAGFVQDDGPDIYDGFAVRADMPIELVFDLESHAEFSDLDVCVYDPDLGEFVVCADGPFDPEHGSVVVLEAGKLLHLVVTSAAGDVGYTLHLQAFPVTLSYAQQGGHAQQGPHAPHALGGTDARKAEVRRGYAAAPAESAADERPVRRVDVLLYDLDTGERAGAEAVLDAGSLRDLRPAPDAR